jgi:molybdate transport repressor ModE-like protein
MDIDPKSLKLFVTVMKLGTITAAARHEHIAAAAVSKRISDLEDLLGTQLVERSTKGLQPTAAGTMLLDLSHRVLNDLEVIRTQVGQYASGIASQVRVFANISAITQFMPSELSGFLAQNPRIKVNIEERVSSVIEQAVLENVADVGILVMGSPVEGLEFHPYREDDLVVAVPKSHPLARRSSTSFVDTLDYDYVGLHTGSQLNLQLIRAASELGRPWSSRVQVTSYDALCLMIEAGLGIGILPKSLAQSYSKALRIKVLGLKEEWAHRTLAVCIRSYDSLTPAARLLVAHLLR